MVRFGVVTISYNNAAGLRRTISSVLSQTHKPHSFVVVDGGSGDETPKLLSTGVWPRWMTWKSERDDGIYDAMNRGLGCVDGDLIVMLNSGDEFFSADTLRLVGAEYDRAPFMWAYGMAELQSSDMSSEHALTHLAWQRFRAGLGTVPHQATYFRRELVHEVGNFRMDLGYAADQEHALRLWMHSPPRNIRTVLARCEAGGVGSNGQVGNFARQMRAFRSMHSISYCPSACDTLVTWLAIVFDGAKQKWSTRPIQLFDWFRGARAK